MKMPNGYGSVYKLSGNRRKPWAARITVGWENAPESMCCKQKYKFIGFYQTRKEALVALSEYNVNPYNIDTTNVTFAEVYQKWSNERFPAISESNVRCYNSAYIVCEPIENKKFIDITLDDLQMCADISGKNLPTLKKYKVLLKQVYKYAVIHDIIPESKNKVEYVNISNFKNPNSIERSPFSNEEINLLWDCFDENIYYTVVLILIYTGCRISEILDLKKCDIDMENHFFNITASKTPSGIRTVPIANKIYPFFEYWFSKNDCEYLLSTPNGIHLSYHNYKTNYWVPLLSKKGMDHRPHDTRHTCISLLADAGVDERIIKCIVGHKGTTDVTYDVYTHYHLSKLMDAINSI